MHANAMYKLSIALWSTYAGEGHPEEDGDDEAFTPGGCRKKQTGSTMRA